MPGTSSISGVMSGLQTDEILEKLRQLEMGAVYRLQSRQVGLNQTLSTWQALNTKLLALKSSMSGLSLPSTYNARAVSVSDPATLSASASSTAALGDYTFTVAALAAAHQIGSQGYADATATLVGDGTITVNGHEITTNGLTLTGLRDAINAAGGGVKASVLNTGSGATPYRLQITSTATGTAGAIACSVSVAGGNAPVFTDVQAAQDAHLVFGSGASAVDVYRSGNRVSDVLDGITLNLAQAGGSPVTLHVGADTSAVKEKIQALVTAYNEAMAFIDEQSRYDSKTQQNGLLFGNVNLMQMQSSLYRAISEPVAGLPSELCLLSQVGLRRNIEGELTLDEVALDAALAENPTGVLKLMAAYADCPAGVSYISSSADTQPSGAAGYALELTQLAAQARATAGVAQIEALAADETLTINGVQILLQAGMTQAQVLAAINQRSSETGVAASATGADGTGGGSYLTLTRIAYGAGPTLTAVSSASSAGGQNTSGLGNLPVTPTDSGGESGSGTGAPGVDVAGSIGGVAAQGSGQTLTGTSGGAQGLSLLVRAATTGALGNVVFTRGALGELNYLLAFLTEDGNSPYQAATDSLEAQIERLDDEIAAAQASVDTKMAYVTRQFEQMEATLAKLQSQSSYLTSQLQQLANSNS